MEIGARSQMESQKPPAKKTRWATITIAVLVVLVAVGVVWKSYLLAHSRVNQAATAVQSEKPKAPVQASDMPSCTTGSQISSSSHAVTLSWNPGIPRSNAPPDAIKGYYIYRSQSSQTYAESNRMNSVLLQGTRCVDTSVEAGNTYYYAVKTITVGGGQSGFSKEIKAVVPSP
jgi:hypothetical protein